MKVLALLIILVALVIVIVPQFTNCEAGKDDAATSMTGAAAPAAPATPYRMMKCYWSAHAEIVAGGITAIVLGETKRENGAGGATPA